MKSLKSEFSKNEPRSLYSTHKKHLDESQTNRNY